LIRSFADKETQSLFESGRSRRFTAFARVAIRKLTQLDTVKTLQKLSCLQEITWNRYEAGEKASIAFG
jgi:plasmid maintenance system killer protein